MKHIIDPSENSFVTVAIINPVLSKIFEKYQSELKEKANFIKISGGKFKISFTENYILPENDGNILDTLFIELIGIKNCNEELLNEISSSKEKIIAEMRFAKFVAGDVTYTEDEFDPEYEFEVYTYKDGKSSFSSITDDGSFYDEFVSYDMPFDFE